jgi:hypothetical protein
MLKISVDYGYAFDVLAIIEVKNKIVGKKNQNYYKLYKEIEEQIGREKMNEVINSNEYIKLIETNQKVFDLVDQAQKDNGLAKQVDSANYERYIVKTNLQKKFFNENITEIKLGYNNEN